MGEMKYLVEQETDNVFIPLVHVNGIVGLNINPDDDTKIQTVDISGEYFAIDSKLFVYQYDNIVSLSLTAKFTDDGIQYLTNGNIIELPISALNNTEVVVLDSVALTGAGSPAIGTNTNVYVNDSKLYIKCDTKSVKYSLNSTGDGIEEIVEDVLFTDIYANGTTTTKSFAPIKPTIPYSYVYFTYSSKTNIVTLGPIDSLREVEFDISSEDADVIVHSENGMHTLSFSNQKNETFTLRVRGNFKSFVYPGMVAVKSIVLEDCYNLEWFSINKNEEGKQMKQQIMLETFAIKGKHRMTDMSHFFDGCTKLVAIDEMYTSNVKNFESFLENCKSLLLFPDIDMDNAINTNKMCKGCTSMTNLPNDDTLHLNNVETAIEMFFDCTSLTHISRISIPKVKLATSMFWNCNALVDILYIDNCQSVTDADNMLAGCTSLISIRCMELTATIDLRDTSILDSDDLIKFLTSLGTVSDTMKSRIYLPQPLDVYAIDDSIIQDIQSKNWEFI